MAAVARKKQYWDVLVAFVIVVEARIEACCRELGWKICRV